MPAFPLLAVVASETVGSSSVSLRKSKELVRFTVEAAVPLGILLGIAFSGNSYLILKLTVFFILFLYPAYFGFLTRFEFTQTVKLVAALMLVSRGFFSSYYYPIAQYKYPKIKEVARQIARDSKGFPLFTKTHYLQLCFYVEKYRDEVLKFEPNPPFNSLFLSQRPEGKVLKVYKAGKHKFYLCSYGINSLTR